jgi:hypothetical protein
MRRIRPLVISAAAAAVALGALPTSAYAQRARVRVGVGVHISSGPRYVRSYRPVYYRPAYYRPFFYNSYFYSPYYYDPFYWDTWWGPQQRRYLRYDDASLRIQVSPKQAEVYVDGYFVGSVDSFDGTFQRLDVRPGEHVVEIFHEGHRPIREVMRFEPRAGYQIKRAMEPLTPGDPAPVRPSPDPNARRSDPRDQPDPREPRDRPAPGGERRDNPPPDRPGDVRTDVREGESGAVALRVQPAGAVILIDGEKWDGPEGPDRLVVHLSEGSHKVEVQKQGYRTFTTEIRVRRGETVPLNISLRTAGAN